MTTDRRTAVVADRLSKLRARLADAPFDAYLAAHPANVDYASGYRSVSAAVHGRATMVAVATPDRTMLAGAVSDSAPAFDFGIDEDDYVAYGRFYFESDGGTAMATRLVDNHTDLASALVTAISRCGLEKATLGIDRGALDASVWDTVQARLGEVNLVDADQWMLGVRASKLPSEVDLLRTSSLLVDDAITAAIENARVGTTENDMARQIAASMAAGGSWPRFVVVTSGPRSALSDCFATDRPIAAGDLVRFDVGGIYEGYWSDLGRTAVVGPPDAKQERYYDAIFEGEQAELDLIRAGLRANEVFGAAVSTVESHGGPNPYRRHHCGHGIGLDVYEPPIISPQVDQVLEAGMTFCLETPFYEIGWGGMMVEDTVVVTADGHERLNNSDRQLRVIQP